MRPSLFTVVALAAFANRARAEAATFALASGESKVQFVSDAPLERITGATTRVTGEIELDPAAPEKARAEIAVPVASIKTNNELRDEHLRSDSWLDAGRFPNVQFALSSVSGLGALPLDQSTSADVRGKLSVHGVTREISTKAKVRLSQGDGRRTLRVQAQFPVALEAHKVAIPSLVQLKVAPVIQVNVDLHAHAPMPTAATREQPAAVATDAGLESSAAQARPVKKVNSTPSAGKSVTKSGSPGGDAAARRLGAAEERPDVGQAEASDAKAGDGSAAPTTAVPAPPPAEASAPAAPSATPAIAEKTAQAASRERGCSAAPGARGTWPLLLAAVLLLRPRRYGRHGSS